MFNDPKYNELRTRVLKGSAILDFLLFIETRRAAETNLLVEAKWLLEEIDETSIEGQERKEFILRMQARDCAYNKIICFMRETFGISENTSESEQKKYQRKSFKGYKIVQTIDFLKFNFLDCKTNIEIFEGMPSVNGYKEIIVFFDEQLDCYLTISKYINDRFYKIYHAKEYSLIKEYASEIYEGISDLEL
ncbi:hypothetical protein IEK_05581 [Bacillus toyonensis]|uniref:hypothetical protein n=1 Tax=Bacillus toyonensis TaxID=155322 RepID=UPI00027BECC5|nr:hypothetical protein [Bacillus toyonensis]EJV42886.1 hypothetical protein IEK_05581 [Bacillus toyonensis]KAB2353648.1 hypothetical protein F8503_29870 [Bacillus toyonensis]PED97877.1 hypothetical protein CON78_24960 [Bacillus toyonensis]PHD31447.1 hypothetical protein COF48_25810 [Bacillus toyonensis]